MKQFGIKEELVYERYKQQKFENSVGFLKIIMKLFLLSASIYLILCLTVIESPSHHIRSMVFLITISTIVQRLNRNAKLSYILGIAFTSMVQFRTMITGLCSFPEYLGLCCAISYFYLWHCQLELVYIKIQGCIIIILHTTVWCFFVYYLGVLTVSPTPHIIIALVYFVIIQLVWFNYHSSKGHQKARRIIELERSDLNVNSLINALPEGIAVLDQNLELLMSNNAFLKLMQGHSIFELQLNRKFNIKEKNTCEDLMKYVKAFTSSQEKITTFGVCFFNNFYIQCTGNKANLNNEVAIVLTFRDVSNIIMLQSESKTTSKTLKMLKGVSHELKTPLNKIIDDHREILNSADALSDCMKKHVVRSLSSAKVLFSLIKDMIDYSHIKVNNLNLNHEWINVYQVIFDCIQLFKDINSDYIIVLKNKLPGIVNIYSDKVRLKQCLLNLIGLSLG